MASVYGAHLQVQASVDTLFTVAPAPPTLLLAHPRPKTGVPQAMTVVSEQQRAKQAARVQAATRRAHAHKQAEPATAGRRLAQTFFAQPGLTGVCRRGMAVSGYWPRSDEIDVRPLLADLQSQGLQVCLPVVIAKSQPLHFRDWGNGDDLVSGPFDVMEPPAAAASLTPRLLLVPLLAFDDRGTRLGYGGGFYDATLAALRRAGPVTAVGVAYAGQQAGALPRDVHDQTLDWVVTDSAAHRFDFER